VCQPAGLDIDDDARTGRLLKLLRRRARITQLELATLAHVPRIDVIRLERGEAGTLQLDRLRRIFNALDARSRFSVWWNGAAADRLLDARHAQLVELTAAALQRRGWTTAIEVSFSEYGERGSIDILAANERRRAVAVIEVKADIGSFEEMHRVLDAKERLAPKVARDRFGWTPLHIGRLLVMPDEDRLRRLVAAHARTMASIYPASSREVRSWLRAPDSSVDGVWFVSDVRDRNMKAT
jgi:transcriptional regulator with XRE-family HTH domain